MKVNKQVIPAILLLFLFSFGSEAREYLIPDYLGVQQEPECPSLETVADNEKGTEVDEETEEEPECD